MLSIILPCYNIAPYIERAMKSLFSQALEDYEVIIVDDGSTDGLLKVCEQWSPLDYVKIIHTENQGVSEARNTGLRMAQGDYVCFMDPDDWLEDNALSEALRLCVDECADAVRFNAPASNTVGGKDLLPRFIGYSLKELDAFGTPQFDKGKELSYVWSYIFRKAMLVDNGIQFAKGLHFMEDKLFLCEFFCYAHKIVQVDKQYYHYCVREDGLNNTNFKDALLHAEQRLLAEKNREKLTERVKQTLGLDLEPLFQGTLILASIELLIIIAKTCSWKKMSILKEYMSLDIVKHAFKDAEPSSFPLKLRIAYYVTNMIRKMI